MRFLQIMNYKEFSKKYRCSISRKLEQRANFHLRPIERKMYYIYIDIKTMLPFNPKTDKDAMNCLTFSSDQSAEHAKRKAYDFIKDKGSLELSLNAC